MKILIVGQWFVSKDSHGMIYVPGGTERYAYGLAKQLQEDGYKVKVLSTIMDKDKIGWDVLDGVSVYRFKMPNRFYGYFIDFLSFVNTLKLIKKFDPDIVHVISTRFRFDIGAVVASKIMKKKTVTTITTLPHEEGRGWLPILFDNFVSTKIIKRVDVIIALSNEMKEILKSKIHPKKMVIIPNPPVKSYYKKMAKEHNSVLFVGRLEIATKGVDLLIKALHYVQMEVPDVKLHICGTGDEKVLDCLLGLVSRYKLQKNILFCGHLNDDALADKYSSCEILVMPSFREGMPLVLIEAMSAGLPIVAFDIGCIAEALDDGKFGILVKKGEVKDLADQIIRLLKNDELKGYYSKKSMERSKKYMQAEVMRNIEKVYSDLMESKIG